MSKMYSCNKKLGQTGLRYVEVGLTHQEVPGESTICVYISGCIVGCLNCHYPELQNPSTGFLLREYIEDIMDLYLQQSTCICFMGEGDCSADSRKELVDYARLAKRKRLKSCLYSGRETAVESWMHVFDYVKTGSYVEESGPLYDRNTNQRLFMKTHQGFSDITNRFWECNV